MENVLSPAQHFIFVELTSLIALAGGLLLWGGFVLIAWVARRFEKIYGHFTYWQLYIVAPAGIFVYLLLQSIASFRHVNRSAAELWSGYALLLWSAMLCLWSAQRFGSVLRFLEKERS